MYLIDTNVFLEGLLEQENFESVQTFFQNVPIENIHITDLSLHSIGIILYQLKKYDLFKRFIDDMIADGINILSISPIDLTNLNITVQKLYLDFDDAYQYFVADKYDLQMISFDKEYLDLISPKNIKPLNPHLWNLLR